MSRTPLRTPRAAFGAALVAGTTLVAGAPLVAGCTSIPGDTNEDGVVDCQDVVGTFTAETLAFRGIDDPGAFEDFGGEPDYTAVFGDGTFQAQLATEVEILTASGDFVADELQLETFAPLVPGQGGGTDLYDCDFDGETLRLFGETTYDFATDPFLAPVAAGFDGTFTWLGPPPDEDD